MEIESHLNQNGINNMSNKEQEYSKTTFNEVANKYDEIEFFKISAKYVVKLIKDKKEDKELDILDVACGTGNVVLECALEMPNSSFDAVDISEGMIIKAKSNVKEKGINNIDFKVQDITSKESKENTKRYDVVTCSYALFFLPEPAEILKVLASLLKEDGIVIFTSFTKDAFMPSSDILMNLLKKYGSSIAKEYDKNKWENLKSIKDIEYLCSLTNIKNIDIKSKDIRYDMSIDKWWELFDNTGFKGMLMQLSTEDYNKLKDEFFDEMNVKLKNNENIELNADSYFVMIDKILLF